MNTLKCQIGVMTIDVIMGLTSEQNDNSKKKLGYENSIN